ncbi:alpha/beta hydrolase [Nocardia sp. NPDC005978]|uniref:alpha/beta fold hydrolase n=1 Tax=Nocardia sp. NPDC005978 TaxID=3156725 RepID=UPI0033BE9BC6
MPSVVINDGHVVYEILGDTGELIVLTPGGRYGMDIPGLRPLAEALVAGGHRVLLWDRPNCGASDVQFFGRTESHMRADTLRGLLTALELGPCVLAGGSGGARDSMLTAILYPELVSRLVLWNIVGGIYGTLNLGAHYILPSLQAVRGRGIEGLLRLREWRERVEANPRNRDRLLSLDREEFLRLSLLWLQAYVPKPGQTIPGVEDDLFDRIQAPTLIIRGGAKDLDHPKRTSLEVHCLIENSVLIDPPWPEDAWERAMEDFVTGRADHYNMFDTWVLAAPEILKFLAEQ